ncbi:hypothetical protein BDV97DRAFT_422725, partial [Delphinella strobiligena]
RSSHHHTPLFTRQANYERPSFLAFRPLFLLAAIDCFTVSFLALLLFSQSHLAPCTLRVSRFHSTPPLDNSSNLTAPARRFSNNTSTPHEIRQSDSSWEAIYIHNSSLVPCLSRATASAAAGQFHHNEIQTLSKTTAGTPDNIQ